MKEINEKVAKFMEMSYDEILAKVNEVTNKLQEDVIKANKMLTDYGFYEFVPNRKYFEKRLFEAFPLIDLVSDVNYKTCEQVAKELSEWKQYAYLPLASNTESIDGKKLSVKLSHKLAYKHEAFLDLLGYESSDYEVTHYKNGKVKYVFKNQKAFDTFVGIVTWRNEQTNKALEALNEDVLQKAFDKGLKTIKFVYACKHNIKGNYENKVSFNVIPEEMFKDLPIQTMQYTDCYFDWLVNKFLLKERVRLFVEQKVKELSESK